MKKPVKYLFLTVVFFLSAFLTIQATNKPQKKAEKNLIPIAMATDNNYVYPTAVAITSLLETKKESTAIDLNIMISEDVSKENKVMLKKFEKLYKNCSVNLINMKRHFNSTYINQKRISSPTYYRLNLPNLLKKYDKVLYLDGDIIVKRDLWWLYRTNLKDSYIAGALDLDVISKDKKSTSENYSEKLKIKDLSRYINAGVIVMNLKKLREDNMQKAFADFIPILKKRKLKFNDQDILNSVCYEKIQIFPQKYNAFSHYCVSKTVSPQSTYSCERPIIIHYAGNIKPWKTKNCNMYSVWEKYEKIAQNKLGLSVATSSEKINQKKKQNPKTKVKNKQSENKISKSAKITRKTKKVA